MKISRRPPPPQAIQWPGERRRRRVAALLSTLFLAVNYVPGALVLAAPQVFARVGPGVSNLPISVAAFNDPSFGEISDAINVASGNAYVDLGQVNRNNTVSTIPGNAGASSDATNGTTSTSGSFNVNGLLKLLGFNTTNPAQPTEWALGTGDGGTTLFKRVVQNGTPAYCVDNRLDVVGIAKYATGTSSTEIHVLNGADNYQTFLAETGTGQGYDSDQTYQLGDWDGDGRPDLIQIALQNTGSGKTEVHVLSAASGFKTYIYHRATALGMVGTNWDFNVFDWNGDGKLDLIGTPKQNTGTNSVEIHVLNGADDFQSYLDQRGTVMPPQPNTSYIGFADWDGDGRRDMVGIYTQNTGTGKTEVHIASAASGFKQWIAETATTHGYLGSNWDMGVGDYDKDGRPDIVTVKKNGTGTRKIEVHILNGATNFQDFMVQTGTALGMMPNDQWTFVTTDYPTNCSAAGYDFNQAPSWIKERYANLRGQVSYYVSSPQVGQQTDETWVVTYTRPNGRQIAHYYDHKGNRTTFYDDGEYADFTQTPHEQYRAAKYQADYEGIGTAAPKMEFTYTAPGNGHLRKVKDSWGRVTSYTWDEAAGTITSIHMLLKNENDDSSYMREVGYEYDIVGNQRQVKKITFNTEDGFGNRGLTRTYTMTYRYGTNNAILLWTVGRPVLGGMPKITTYTYDLQNRVIRTSTLGEPDTTFSYENSGTDTGAGGLQVTQVQGDKRIVYQFSPEGWLRNRSERNFNPSTGRDYNPTGNNIWSGSNAISWYDASGRIIAQSTSDGIQVQRTYDQHGNIKTEAIYSPGINWADPPPAGYKRIQRYAYNNDNELVQWNQDAASGSGNSNGTLASDASYSYSGIQKNFYYQKHEAASNPWNVTTANQVVGEKLYVNGGIKREFQTGIDAYGRVSNTVLYIGGSPYKTVDYTYYAAGTQQNLVYPTSMTTPNYDANKAVLQYADQVATKVVNAAQDGGIRTEYLYDEYGNVARELVVNAYVYNWSGATKKLAQTHHWTMYNGYGQMVWESLWGYEPDTPGQWPQVISRKWNYYPTGEVNVMWDGTTDHMTDYRYNDNASSPNYGHLTQVAEGVGDWSYYGIKTQRKLTEYNYDDYGRVNSETIDGFTTKTQYTTLDQPALVTLPDGSYTQYQTSISGLPDYEVQGNTDGKTSVTYHRRDGMGREYETETVVNGNSQGKVVTYYDAFDHPVKVTDHRLSMVNGDSARSSYMKYDSFGNVLHKLGPMLTVQGAPGYTDTRRTYNGYSYDQLDRQVGQCQLLTGMINDPNTMQTTGNANCPWTSTQYDAFDRPIQTTNQDGYSTKLIYDNSDNIIQTDKQVWKGGEDGYVYNSGFTWVTTRTSYDAAARVYQSVDARGNVSRNEYNIFGPTAHFDERGIRTKGLAYTADGLLQYTTEPAFNDVNNMQVMEYRDYGARELPYRICTATMNTTAWSNQGACTVYTYDYAGRPVNTALPADQNGKVSTIVQSYHNNGEPLSVTDANGFNTTFEYTALGQLSAKHENARSGNSIDVNAGLSGGLHSTYSYDTAGNLTKKTEHGLTTEYKYNTLGKVIAESRPRVGDTTPTNWKLTTYNLYGLPTAKTSYDYAGNLASVPDVTDPWDTRISHTRGNMTMPWYYARGLQIGEVSLGTDTAGNRTWEYTKNLFRNGLGQLVFRKFWGNIGIYAEQTDASGTKLGHSNYWTIQKYDQNGNLTNKWDAPGNSDNSAPYDLNLAQNVFTYTYSPTNKELSSTRSVAVRVKGDSTSNYYFNIQGGNTGILLTGSTAKTSTVYNNRDFMHTVTTTEQSPTPSQTNGTGYNAYAEIPYLHYNFGSGITKTTSYGYYASGERYYIDVSGSGTKYFNGYDLRGRQTNVYDTNGPRSGSNGLSGNIPTTILSNYESGKQTVQYIQNGSTLYTETTLITVGGRTANYNSNFSTKQYKYEPNLGLIASGTDAQNYSAGSSVIYDAYAQDISTTYNTGEGITYNKAFNSNGVQTGYNSSNGANTMTYTLDSRGNRLRQDGTQNWNVSPDSGMIKRYNADDLVTTFNSTSGSSFCGSGFCSGGSGKRYNDFRYDPYGQMVVTGTSNIQTGGYQGREYKVIRNVRSIVPVNGEVQYVFGRGNQNEANSQFWRYENWAQSGLRDDYAAFGYIIKDQTYSKADGLTDTEEWSGAQPFIATAGNVETLAAPVQSLSTALKVNPLDIATPALPKLPDPSQIQNKVKEQEGGKIDAPAPTQKEVVKPQPKDKAAAEVKTVQTMSIIVNPVTPELPEAELMDDQVQNSDWTVTMTGGISAVDYSEEASEADYGEDDGFGEQSLSSENKRNATDLLNEVRARHGMDPVAPPSTTPRAAKDITNYNLVAVRTGNPLAMITSGEYDNMADTERVTVRTIAEESGNYSFRESDAEVREARAKGSTGINYQGIERISYLAGLPVPPPKVKNDVDNFTSAAGRKASAMLDYLIGNVDGKFDMDDVRARLAGMSDLPPHLGGIEGKLGLLAIGSLGGKVVPKLAAPTWKAGQDVIHFNKHGGEIANALGLKSYDLAAYLDDAQIIIKNGKFVPELNAYVQIIGGKGSAKAMMVGLDRKTGEITTLHIKTVKELAKNAPSLGWQK